MMVRSNGKKILLVDDTKTVVLFEKMLLAGEGFDIRYAYNGQDALELIADDPPDLVLLDLIMPKMDGYEVCTRLKSDSNTADIPIIVVSTRSSEESVERCLNLGADYYIFKPINKLELLEKISSALGLK
ncbi:MAG: response regulator [bacterium]|nr:response regulator [bacterium]